MASNKRMWGGEGGGGVENRHRFFFFFSVPASILVVLPDTHRLSFIPHSCFQHSLTQSLIRNFPPVFTSLSLHCI